MRSLEADDAEHWQVQWNFFWKFKLAIGLDLVDLWGIVDEPKEASPSNVNLNMINDYGRHAKKTMSIIAHTKSCKRLAEV